MKKPRIFVCAVLLMCAALTHTGLAQTRNQSSRKNSQQDNRTTHGAIETQAATPTPVTGSGIAGQLPKWAGNSSTSYVLTDSIITEDKTGKIGIGTIAPTSKLTVQGMIETTLGGYKFPDGTIQTTSGIALVTHDTTLTGNGTPASPLGIANGGVGTAQLANNAVTAAKVAPAQVVKRLNGLTDSVVLQAGANMAITTAGNTLTIASTAGDPASSAFQGNLIINFGDGEGLSSGTLAVPAGKRLAIEFISITSSIPADQELVDILLTTTVNGTALDYRLSVQATGSDASPYKYVADKLVRIYADSGANLVAVASRTPGNGGANIQIRLSGYLVNLP
jgi:hypothetical protein